MRTFSRRLVHFYLFAIAFSTNLYAFSKHIEPQVAIDTNAIAIGGQTKLTLRLEINRGQHFLWPVIADTIGSSIEIVNQTGIDSIVSKDNSKILLTQHITITSFDTGYHVIPPLLFKLRNSNDDPWQNFESSPLLLHVSGVEVDPDQPIKDIKNLMSAPYTFLEIIKWVIPFLLLGLATFGIWYYMKKRKQNKPLVRLPKKPAIPPHRIAFDELEDLRTKRLWQNGRVKEYHSELTDIVRKYIENRFQFLALEMTTTEILAKAAQINIESKAASLLEDMLVRADLVKFAKSQPLPDEHERSFSEALDFVKTTIPVLPEAVSVVEPVSDPVQSKEGGAE